ncbi:PAS domain S-box-containing protein [Streptomyces sp. 2224.1]|uniref:SpoIIE family protein phosphatase n=1 Tax=unclassified Streptomyces TaxID=2593676 RepID=UPI000883F240|nr:MULTISPECIES: SpoIIE family protein phosphatase [unclassified Streptomyces]PBC81571.1 PAS domain S-box-containing protein [Streptomyces sp. 2321.6]SDR54229.1 PAS domain S-box-containing protein [Streptomyces sp. KS_16]SEC20956.1 PAS domain S-box-containing protein [Streptomyces sp. 2133.1]SED11679.1 PAS domain S-box-containing protein [Streptomyces sp. 2224.1]SEF06807.1 PAS domain S-box-containing protein [Streptomyces sp. 2112.3]
MSASQSSRLSGDGVFDLTRTAVVMADRAGVAQGWTAGAERLLGYRVSEAVGRPLADLFAGVGAGSEQDSRWESRLASADGWSGLEAVRHKDGHRLDLEFRVLPVMDAHSGFSRLVLAAEMARTPWSGASRSFLEGILGMSPIGVAMVNAELQFVWLNDALEQMGGTSREQRLGKRLAEVQPGLAVEAIETEMRRVLRTGTPSVGYEYLGRPQSDPEREHAYSTSFFRLEDEAGQVLGVCYMVLDVTEGYRARQRMALLNKAGERIGSSLDVWQTAQELADAAVPDLADFVTVDLLDALLSGEEAADPLDAADLLTMRRAGAQSVHEGCPEAVVAIGEPAAYPPSAPVVASLTKGDSTLLRTLDTADGDPWDEDPVRAAQLRAGGFHSLMVVPLRARGVFLGAATFARWQATGPFQSDDLVLAEEFVARAAISIDNARRYTREHTAALTLQHSLLPHALPEQCAVEAAYRYLPADSLSGVGGDWFDVIPLSGARVALVVGDVVGHGMHAAATMGRLRAAVQALADLDLSPEEVLAHLDDMLNRVAHDANADDGVIGATCLYAVYDPVSCRCTLARAGHPAPLLVGPDGAGKLLDLPTGPPLGLGGMPFESVELPLREGSLLALYTNGLLLGKALDLDGGITRLRQALADPKAPLEDLCETVIGGLPGGRPVDDVALLLARTRALPRTRLATWEIPADPSAVGEARRTAARLLREWGLEELGFSTELIVSELVTNAIRHASGPIGLRMIRAGELICEVSDASSTTPHLRHARTTDEGGRGLFLIARYAQRWGTRYTAQGKIIWAELPLGPTTGTAPPADLGTLLEDLDDQADFTSAEGR